jgi:hypothetical protein
MLEDEELDVKPLIQKRANAPAQHAVNAMPSEECNPMVIESDVSRRSSPGNAFCEQAGVKIRRHAVCPNQTKPDRWLEREEVAVRWIVIFLLGFLLGLSVFGLIKGFALAEATILFAGILALSTLWMLSSWGERSGSGEREV